MTDATAERTASGEKPDNTAARILYRPFGLVASIVGGIVAGQVFKRLYKRLSPGHKPDAPTALQSEYSAREVVLTAIVQGAVFAGVKALIDRGGARAFERWTGEWPGD